MGRGDMFTQSLCLTLFLEHPDSGVLYARIHIPAPPTRTAEGEWCCQLYALLDLRGEQRRLLGRSLRWAGVSMCVGEAVSNARKSWEWAEEGVRPEATVHTVPHSGMELQSRGEP